MSKFSNKLPILTIALLLGEGILHLPLVRRAVAAEEAPTSQTEPIHQAAPPTPVSSTEPVGLTEPQPPAKEKPVKIPEVVVEEVRKRDYRAESSATATKTDTPLRDVPQTVNVITGELIKDQAAFSVKDALRNVPGLTMQGGEGGSTADNFTIRGFRASTDIFLDGVRDDGDFFRDLSNIDRIDVLKGPAAMLFGRGSAGGLVNFITRKPQSRPVRNLQFSYGSFDQKRGSIDLAGPLGGEAFAFRLTGAGESANGFRDSSFLDRATVAPAVAWQPTADTKVTLQGDYLDDKRLWDGGIPAVNGRPADVPINTFYGSSSDKLHNVIGRGTLTIEHRFSQAWSLREVLRITDLSTDGTRTQLLQVMQGGVLTIDQQNRRELLINRKKEASYNQIEMVHRGEYFGISHTMLAGFEIGRQRNESTSVSRTLAGNFPLLNPTPFLHAPFGAPTNSSKAVSDIVGLYLQDQLAFGKHWKALAGFRYNVFDTKVEDRIKRTTLSRTDRAFSPRAGLVWQPTEASAFYASYSKSFQPSAENLSLNAANAVLEPEITQGYEVGSKLDFLDGRLSVNAALFRLERTNIKTASLLDPNIQVNAGVQRTDGFELALTGEPARGWKLYAGYAYLDAEIVRSTTVVDGVLLQGKVPLNTPRHSGSLWSTYTFPSGFSVGVGVNYVGDRFGRDSNSVLLPSYVTADCLLFYQQKHYEVALNIRNLTDKKYFEAGNFGGQAFPGTPLSAVVTLRANF